MQRITQKDLESVIEVLARHLGTKYGSNPGNLCLDCAYGGVKVVQITERGGERNILSRPYSTKSETYKAVTAAIMGIEAYKSTMPNVTTD